MKKLLLSFALVFTLWSSASAQTLYYTTWSVYDPGNLFFSYFKFTSDTLSFSPDNITYTAISNFLESGNNFTIFDIGFTGCNPADTGYYTFAISNDTLRFTLISDLCLARSGVLSTYYGVLFATGIETQNPSTAIRLFPNPSTDGIYKLTIADNLNEYDKLFVTTVEGKLISEAKLPEHGSIDRTINLSDFPAGIYFLTLQGHSGNKVIKLLK